MYTSTLDRKKQARKLTRKWKFTQLPSGHFSAGRITTKEDVKTGDVECDMSYADITVVHRIYGEKDFNQEIVKYTGKKNKETGIVYFHDENGQLEKGYYEEIYSKIEHYIDKKNVENDIGLSNALNSRKAKKHGLKGISQAGRIAVREGCYMLGKEFGKKNLSFVTLTVPYHGEYLKKINENWSKIVHRYYEEIGRFYQRKGVKFRYVSVTEIQEKRYKAYGECAPHLHYVCNGTFKKDYIMKPREIRSVFKRVCERFIGETDVDWSACENVQRVKKDAGRYLSKYMSKGGELISEIAEKMPEQLPRHYWKVDKETKISVKRNTKTYYDEECWNALEICKAGIKDSSKNWFKEVYISVEEKVHVLFGYCGYNSTLRI